MERTQLLDLMGELKLYGMKAAYDEIMATAVKRQHEPQRIVGDLLNAEINEKQARSIKYQLTMSKPATRAGASKAATTIKQPALAPSPQPRPAPTGQALPPCRVESKEARKWLDNKPQLKGRITF